MYSPSGGPQSPIPQPLRLGAIIAPCSNPSTSPSSSSSVIPATSSTNPTPTPSPPAASGNTFAKRAPRRDNLCQIPPFPLGSDSGHCATEPCRSACYPKASKFRSSGSLRRRGKIWMVLTFPTCLESRPLPSCPCLHDREYGNGRRLFLENPRI